MFDSTFISCPDIGFDHLLKMVTREFNAINGHPQWDVQYPTPSMPTHLSDAEYDQFVDDVAAEMEDQDAQCCEFGDECIICSQPDDDQDHCIVRPDDDLAEEGANSAFESNAEYLEAEQDSFDEIVAESDSMYDTMREQDGLFI